MSLHELRFPVAAQETASTVNNIMQRVKVYRMNKDSKWEDRGTGHVTIDYLERSENLGLFVIDEEVNATVLLHRIRSEDIYRKQEEMIISWSDPELLTEVALSFQEPTGCLYIWDHICTVQRNMQFSNITDETFHNVNTELRELPTVELASLPVILKAIVDSGVTDQLRVTELILRQQDFFRKLMEEFRSCEELNKVEDLHLIFEIVKGIISLNSLQIFEIIFQDALIMDIIGCLEYDPNVVPRVHHRSFLKEHVIKKEALPIKDPVVLSKIHQTSRVSFLKDSVLPSTINEGVITNLNVIIHSNNAFVVSVLKDDDTFIKELFARLKCQSTSKESRKTLLHILHEFCTLSKSLHKEHQEKLYGDLASEGIFDTITDVLLSEDEMLVLTGTDILSFFLNWDSNVVRTYVNRQDDVLVGVLVQYFLRDFGNLQYQFLEILRSLLEPNANASEPQKDTVVEYVEIFYKKHLGQLIDVIATSSSYPPNVGSSDGGSENQRSVQPDILNNICELLIFCMSHHPDKIKSSFLVDNVIHKVLSLTRRREKYLVVSAVRFTRTLISRSDEHLMNYFVENNLLKPIVDAFVANGNRYNLLNSVVLELFEYIRKVNLEILLRYLIDKFWDQLAMFESFSSISDLKVKYDQLVEPGRINPGGLIEQRRQIDDRALERGEGDSSNDSNEEDSAMAQTANTSRSQHLPPFPTGSSHPLPNRSGGLVDYDDDDDEDENDNPPPEKKTEESSNVAGVADLGLKHKLTSEEEPESKRLKTADGQYGKQNVEEKQSISSSGESQSSQTENQADIKQDSVTDGSSDSASLPTKSTPPGGS